MGPTLLMKASDKLKHADHKIPDDMRAIDYIINWVRARMVKAPKDFGGLKDRILILHSSVGTGKSTTAPVELFYLLRQKDSRSEYRGPGVLVTQPRVLTAKDIPEKLVKDDWNPLTANEIGFKTGEFTQKPNYNGLLYSTIGVLRAQLNMDDDSVIFNKYKMIVIDEAHEASNDLYSTMMKLKYFYLRNKDNPNLPFLIFTSGTMDTKKYAEYFGLDKENIMAVSGMSYPKTNHWHDEPVTDIKKSLIEKIMHIHKTYDDAPKKGDIMVFVNSTKPWQKDNIKGTIEELAHDILVVFVDRENVNGQTDDYLYATNNKPLPEGKRRQVIFATNAAETGLTVESLRFVIDIGIATNSEIYFPYGFNGLVDRPVARSNVEQRRGRCGRQFPGDFMPLYSEAAYNSLQEQQYPEIVSTGPDSIILDIIQTQQNYKLAIKERPEFTVEDVDTLDLPPVDSLLASLEKCLLFGYTSYNADLPTTKKSKGYGITELGKIVLRLSRYLTLETARVLLSCYMFEVCSQDAIMLSIILQKDLFRFMNTRNVFKQNIIKHCLPSCFQGMSDEVSTFRQITSCQFIELLCIMSTLIYKIDTLNTQEYEQWIESLGMTSHNVLQIVKKYNEISKELMVLGINTSCNQHRKLILCDSIDDFMELVIQIKTSLYSGLLLNSLYYSEDNQGRGGYKTRHGIPIRMRLPDGLIVKQPQVLITNVINLGKKFGEEAMYELKIDLFSVIDGYCGDILDSLSFNNCNNAPRPNR